MPPNVVSNRAPDDVSAHTIDTLISRLRSKMRFGTAQSPIVTVRNVGYALVTAGRIRRGS